VIPARKVVSTLLAIMRARPNKRGFIVSGIVDLRHTFNISKGRVSDLKVPKREIFDRSDFPDFYTMKSLRVGDFGVKIKKILKIFRGSFRGAKFLTRMLSVFLRRIFF
jgi:hypothetical protein